MVKNTLFKIKSKRIKIILHWLILILSVSSIPWYKTYIVPEQSWFVVITTGIGSVFGGLLVSCFVFGGQLSNKYISRKTLDFICRYTIYFCYSLLLVLLFGNYMAYFNSSDFMGLIHICVTLGMLLGLRLVRSEIEKENLSVIISEKKMSQISVAAFVLLPLAIIIINNNLISVSLGVIWMVFIVPVCILYTIDRFRT